MVPVALNCNMHSVYVFPDQKILYGCNVGSQNSQYLMKLQKDNIMSTKLRTFCNRLMVNK